MSPEAAATLAAAIVTALLSNTFPMLEFASAKRASSIVTNCDTFQEHTWRTGDSFVTGFFKRTTSSI